MMKSTLLTLVLAASLTIATYGQTARFTGSFTGDGTLVIADGTHHIRIPDISEPSDHCPTAPYVHSIQKRHGDYYVVVTISHWTRGYPPRGGAGGSGEEAYIKWLHIVDGKISESTEGLFRSWGDNRDGFIDGWHDSIFKVTTNDLLEDKLKAKEKDIWQDIIYTFDARHPENGIKEEKGNPYE